MLGEIYLLHFLAGLGFETNRRRARADQRAETFAETGFCHALQVIGSDDHASKQQRVFSSVDPDSV